MTSRSDKLIAEMVRRVEAVDVLEHERRHKGEASEVNVFEVVEQPHMQDEIV